MSKIVQFGSRRTPRNRRRPSRPTCATTSSAIGSGAEDSVGSSVTLGPLFAFPQFVAVKSGASLDGRQAFDPMFQLFAALDDNGRAGRAVIMDFSADEFIEFRAQIDACLAKCGTSLIDDAAMTMDDRG